LPNDVNATFTAQVDAHRRALTQRNHTGTHLLHHALRKVLGSHVEQKGSLVAPDRLRFDISHFAKITPEELARIEQEVNAMVRADLALVERRETPIKEALDMGAMALFGEKYGDKVRVIKFGESVELCGGTHVPRTGEIGTLRIVSESALAAGIRRIEAITSEAADAYVNERLAKLEEVADLLKNPVDVAASVRQLQERNSALTKELEKASRERVRNLAVSLPAQAKRNKQGLLVLVMPLDLVAQGFKDLGHQLRVQPPVLALVSGSAVGGKPLLAASMGPEFLASGGMKATEAVKRIASAIKGGGGGHPEFATAGGKDASGLEAALQLAAQMLA
jgi:alanyl-tRNA synthetase